MSERSYLIKSVVIFYAIGIAIYSTDLAVCNYKGLKNCDTIRGRLEGALLAAPASLLALLVKSASTDDPISKQNSTARKARPSESGGVGASQNRR